MTCPDCGSRIKHGMTVCPVCGRKVRTATVTETVVRNGRDYETERTIDYGDEDSLKLTLIKYGMSAISCLLPVIFVVAYLWLF